MFLVIYEKKNLFYWNKGLSGFYLKLLAKSFPKKKHSLFRILCFVFKDRILNKCGRKKEKNCKVFNPFCVKVLLFMKTLKKIQN